MSRHSATKRSPQEGLITGLAVGGTFIIIALIIISTPDIGGKINNFFTDLRDVSFQLSTNNNLVLFAPAHPQQQIGFFTALMNFFLGIGILQIIILALRIVVRSSIGRIAETIGNLIFWLGGAMLASVFLLAGTQTGWFLFWAWLITLVGVSLIVRGGVLFAGRGLRRQ